MPLGRPVVLSLKHRRGLESGVMRYGAGAVHMGAMGDAMQDHDSGRVVKPDDDSVVATATGAVARQFTGERLGHSRWVPRQDRGDELDDGSGHPRRQTSQVTVETACGDDSPQHLRVLSVFRDHRGGKP